jgi:hypothetical protein
MLQDCPYDFGFLIYAFLANSLSQVGKYGTPTRCNNNSFIDLQDQLNMFRASFCPSSGAQG